jgi:hypothetical protein
MSTENLISEVLEKYEYLKDLGLFIRKSDGKAIGQQEGVRYTTLKVDGKTYYAHRLVWLLETGSFPDSYIDHINGNKRDNRYMNLRKCGHSENMINRPRQSNNKTGFKGVRLRSDGKKYDAQIGLNGKRYHLGSFDTPEEAAKAYRESAIKMHGEFIRDLP